MVGVDDEICPRKGKSPQYRGGEPGEYKFCGGSPTKLGVPKISFPPKDLNLWGEKPLSLPQVLPFSMR